MALDSRLTKYAFGIAIWPLLVVVLDWCLGYLGWGAVAFTWSPLGTILSLTSWIWPLLVLVCLPPLRPAVRWPVIVVLTAAMIVEGLHALVTLLFVPLTLATGYAEGEQPLFVTQAGPDRVVVYAEPPLLYFGRHGVSIRQERRLAPGLVRTRGVYYGEPVRDAAVRLERPDSLRITTWLGDHQSGPSKDTVIGFRPLP